MRLCSDAEEALANFQLKSPAGKSKRRSREQSPERVAAGGGSGQAAALAVRAGAPGRDHAPDLWRTRVAEPVAGGAGRDRGPAVARRRDDGRRRGSALRAK